MNFISRLFDNYESIFDFNFLNETLCFQFTFIQIIVNQSLQMNAFILLKQIEFNKSSLVKIDSDSFDGSNKLENVSFIDVKQIMKFKYIQKHLLTVILKN